MLLLEFDQEQRPVALRVEMAAYIGVDFLAQYGCCPIAVFGLEIVDHVAHAENHIVAAHKRRTLGDDLGVAFRQLLTQRFVRPTQRDDLLQPQAAKITPPIETHDQQPHTVKYQREGQQIARDSPPRSIPGCQNIQRETAGLRPTAEAVGHHHFEEIMALGQTGVFGLSRTVGFRPCIVHSDHPVTELRSGQQSLP